MKRLTQSLKKNEPVLAWLLIIVLAFIWGSSFILIKRGLDSFTPFQVGTVRIAFSFLALAPYAFIRLKTVSKDKLPYIILSGIIGNLIPAVLFSIAETKITSSLAGILNALTPMFTLLISVFLFRQKTGIVQIAGLLLAFTGCISLSFVNDSGDFGSMNFYVWFVVIATLLYGVNVNLIKTKLKDIDIITLSAVALSFSGIIALIFLLFTDFLSRLNSDPNSFASLGYISILGVLGTAIAGILMNKVIKISTPVFATSVTYLIPFVAVLWGLLENEPLYLLHYAGMIITLTGIYLINKNR